ncbi:MAG: hypothetical protein AAF656_00480 [Planctomycetota bacterium]
MNYRLREIAWKDAKPRSLDIDNRIIKSFHSILQVGVVLTSGRKVALFKRPDKELDGGEKITKQFSCLVSWSPKSFDPSTMRKAFGNKAHLSAGPVLKWKPIGVAATDICERSQPFAPHYVFLLYQAEVKDEGRVSTKVPPDSRKDREHFAGWHPLSKYNHSTIAERFFDPNQNKHIPIEIEGAIDNLVMWRLQKNTDEDLEETIRGDARYYPKCSVPDDGCEPDLDDSGIETDEYMNDLMTVVAQLRKINAANGEAEKPIAVDDVLKLEPSFFGMGVRIPALIKWVRRMYSRAAS